MHSELRILIVDDDPVMPAMLEAALAGACTVAGATGGREALARCARGDVDLIVLDVEMPGFDGYDTCRALRAGEAGAEATELPVIFLSGHAGIDERLRGYAVGGDDYVLKPFDAAELRAKIDRTLQARRRHRDIAGQLDEMTQTALSTVEMMGDAGVVLDFQRTVAGCQTYEAVAAALLEAMGRFQLEGCVRLRGADAACTRNSRGAATALEGSILDHLTMREADVTVHAIGNHTGIRLPHLLLFVRGLQLVRPASMERSLAERMGRQVDNVVLLAQSADTQVQAIDSRRAFSQLAGSRRLVQITRNALVDISARDHSQRGQIRDIFERLNGAVEQSFVSLGLTSAQEEQLVAVIREHGDEVAAVLASGHEVASRLAKVIGQLESAH